jgi:hypothetical protein
MASAFQTNAKVKVIPLGLQKLQERSKSKFKVNMEML